MNKSKQLKRWIMPGILVLLVIVALAALWWLNNPSSSETSEPEPDSAPAPSTSSLSVVDFGAVPDDDNDDYQAIMDCIEEAKKQGKSVYVPAGNFKVSRIITLDGVGMAGAGSDKTILTSTDPENGSIDLKGRNVSLSHLAHIYETTVERGNGANEKNSITVRGAKDFAINHVRIEKASTAGILVQGSAEGGKIENNTIDATGADGIHITSGSRDITIENNKVRRTGDDTIAVVSYRDGSPAASDITIRGNDVGYGSKARGISVVGGSDVTIENNTIRDTEMAGIYIAVEKEWDTDNVKDVKVTGNTIDHTGMREPNDHPNVLVYASQGELTEVSFTDNQILNAPHNGIGVWGDGNIGNIYFTSNTISKSQETPTVFKKGTIHKENNKGF
ncbi:right-handed parallel beta-helix repeat-containing protein [Paenibacillus sp. JX-17]|uniref:Right-handed parallel beta-helix repeat-containing protein n=1 Tax=Paenibacillus lacisoli TaxID=3064525 RepID=A0ABT9CGS0_9BACL|nr:right-handed parallel beta-helix repeat-containing protein [Paenibacillus sp. JX-17]MDO7908401.1 right-handed parallel beta-helix repeat-containing protein [Paenibacillus sp. JX-17]